MKLTNPKTKEQVTILVLKQLTNAQAFTYNFIKANPGCCIADIKRKSTLDYRTIWQHIQYFEKAGRVKIEQSEHKAGKPLRIYLLNKIQRKKQDESYNKN